MLLRILLIKFYLTLSLKRKKRKKNKWLFKKLLRKSSTMARLFKIVLTTLMVRRKRVNHTSLVSSLHGVQMIHPWVNTGLSSYLKLRNILRAMMATI